MPTSQATRRVSGDVRRGSARGVSARRPSDQRHDHEDHRDDQQEVAVAQRAQHLAGVVARRSIGGHVEVVGVRLRPHVARSPRQPQDQVEGDRRGRPGQDRPDPSAGDEHERDRQDRRGEQRLHRDRGADAEAEPHGPPDGDLVAPPERERDGERGEREGGAVGRDRSRDPQARAGDAHEPGGDDRAVAVGDGPPGRVGGGRRAAAPPASRARVGRWRCAGPAGPRPRAGGGTGAPGSRTRRGTAGRRLAWRRPRRRRRRRRR